MTTATLTTLDQAVAAFQAKFTELAFLQATTEEITLQLSALIATVDAAIPLDDLFGKLLFNDVSALDLAANQEILKSYINRQAVDDAANFVDIIETQILAAPNQLLSATGSFIWTAGNFIDLEGGISTGVTYVAAGAGLLNGVIGLVSGGLGLAAAVDDFLQVKAAGTGGSTLTLAELGVADASLGVAGTLASTIQSSIVLGYLLSGQSTNAWAAWGFGLVSRFSDAAVGASSIAKVVGAGSATFGTLTALAQIGISAYNFAETVKGWQEADAAGMPVSVEDKAIAGVSFALNTLAGVLGAVGGVATLVFPPAGLVIGLVAAVVGALAFLFDLFTGFSKPFVDKVYEGTEDDDEIFATTLSSLQVNSLGGNDFIKPVPLWDGTLPFAASDSLNKVDGGTGTDTLDVSGANTFLSAYANTLPVNIVTLGGSWSVDRDTQPGSPNQTDWPVAQVVNIENVYGSTGQDSITGDIKDNVLVGRAGNDTILGGDGDDIISGGAGFDSLDGGAGNDTINYGLDPSDAAELGSGSLGFEIRLDLQTARKLGTNINTPGNHLDTITGFENAVGTNQIDRITGSSVANLLVGRAANDFIDGGDGNDTIAGGAGFDTLYGGVGIDTVNYFIDKSEGTEWYGKAGVDINLTTQVVRERNFGTTIDTLSGFENAVGTDQGDALVGSVGANLLIGVGGNDHIIGDRGNDTLLGGTGNDLVEGGEDNDLISGGNNQDTLYGGAGIDTLSYLIDADDADGYGDGVGFNIDLTYSGVQRADRLSLSPDPTTFEDFIALFENVIGSNAADKIYGNSVANFLSGAAGADLIAGADGNDTLIGGDGADTIRGDRDNDVISGGQGFDSLDGGEGIDTISYSSDDGDAKSTRNGAGVHIELFNQTVRSRLHGDNIDTISNFENAIGSDGSDVLIGSDIGNILIGMDGNDNIDGGFGNDTLVAGNGNDTVLGGENDDILAGGAGLDALNGGAGSDTLSYSVDANDADGYGDGWGFAINLQSGRTEKVTTSSVLEDTFSGIENVVGSGVVDLIWGDSQANSLLGMAGDDTLNGWAGNDTVVGGTGADAINGGVDNDVLSGGAGRDTLDGGAGIDTLSYQLDGEDADGYGDGFGFFIDLNQSLVTKTGAGTSIVEDQISGFENVVGSDATDGIKGSAVANALFGMGGNDSIYGAIGNDTIFGGKSNDGLFGDEDADFFSGGLGNDSIYGGTGTDTLAYNADNDELVYTAINADLAAGTVQITRTGGPVETDTVSEIEVVIATVGNDTLLGDAYANQLIGIEGNDVIDGRGGDDLLVGGDGNDSLTGGANNDQLSGGLGNDTLDGGADSDTAIYSDEDARWSIDLVLGTAARGSAAGGAFVAEDTLRNVENVVTGMRNDIVKGNDQLNQIVTGAGNDTVDGGAGDDMIAGDAGNDSLSGGADDDILVGGTGNDTIDGGTGRDTAAYSEGLSGELFATYGTTLAGFDITVGSTSTTVKALSTTGAILETDTLTTVESILVSDKAETVRINAAISFSTDAARGVDTLDLSGLGSTTGAYANLVTGNVTLVQVGTTIVQSHLNYENVTGTGTTDTLIGTDGNNILIGGGGNDLLVGGLGVDRLDGGADYDTVSYSTSLAGISINLATQTVTGGEGTGDTLISIENVIGTKFSDMIIGSSGSNALNGGEGSDALIGGGGADSFYFELGTSQDVIQDFSSDDRIYLKGFTGVTSFAQVQSKATQVGSDVHLTLNATDKIVISNYALNQLQADDFQFA